MKDDYDEALRLHERVSELIELGPDGEVDAYIRELVPTGIYEHFKSVDGNRMFYAVEGAGRDVDDGPYRVAYRSLYGEHDGDLAFRELVSEKKGFLMPVDRPSYRGRRFRLLEACSREELMKIAEKYRD